MLRKLRRRFILTVMSVFAAVMLVLVTGINVLNGFQMKLSQDRKLEQLLEYEKMMGQFSPEEQPPIYDMPWAGGAETEFTIRFFVIHCNREGDIRVFGNEYISSVDEAAAQSYTRAILAEKKEKGYYKTYRYLVAEETKEELLLVFLNVEDAVQFQKTLLIVSVLAGVGSFLVVFILVWIFSRQAIQPYLCTMERQKQFITDAGHELKTPITSIAASADILAIELEGNEWVDNIRRQTVRLTGLVNDLVTLSRLEEELPYPKKTEFSLSDAAWEIAEPFSAIAMQKHKEFTQRIAEGVVIYGDKPAIQQMLSILLDNAVKYSDKEGKIELDIRKIRNRVVIRVYNTCEQGEELELDRLFDRFYRPDKSRSAYTGGSGIGLSIAQMIASAHGGRISVQTVNTNALVFQVVL